MAQDIDSEQAPQSRLRADVAKVINALIFETSGGQRFTQDSPIWPDVWLAYAASPLEQQELILTVDYKKSAGAAAYTLAERLVAYRKAAPSLGKKDQADRKDARISYIPGQIAARLYFDELIRIVLPMTPWWRDLIRRLVRNAEKNETDSRTSPHGQYLKLRNAGGFPANAGDEFSTPVLVAALMDQRDEVLRLTDFDPVKHPLPGSLTWLIRLAGLLGLAIKNQNERLLSDADPVGVGLKKDFEARLYDRIERDEEQRGRMAREAQEPEDAKRHCGLLVDGFAFLFRAIDGYNETDISASTPIFRVSRNRRIHLAVNQSAMTVKADASLRLFDLRCREITWAVIDSGIDRTHPAFRDLSDETYNKLKDKNGVPPLLDDLPTRVIKTLDFTKLRSMMEIDLAALAAKAANQATVGFRAGQSPFFDRVVARMASSRGLPATNPGVMAEATTAIEALKKRIDEGKDIEWQELSPFIDLPHPELKKDATSLAPPPPDPERKHESPEYPQSDHGTHVAGILAADWIDEEIEAEKTWVPSQRKRKMRGVCPDINLIDVRVFRRDGLTDEFELIAALQYLRWMNSRAGTTRIHGANMSLSLVHQVRKGACGKSPICIECDEAISSGLVVVAAAGNRGFEAEDDSMVRFSDGYRTVSITDPGNAASVITVGATHRNRPHEYGVSYFSSRGPTGDGRIKPDVVAPGEKITAPIMRGGEAEMDGTSMAAPHVSGIAAMLMARYSELIGDPERIKQIICSTATDLGRERYFQGHGLVNALRALQSV